MLEYARWKYILVVVVLALAVLCALPNVFGEDPALQVARKDHTPVTEDAQKEIGKFLTQRAVIIQNTVSANTLEEDVEVEIFVVESQIETIGNFRQIAAEVYTVMGIDHFIAILIYIA